MLPSFKAAPNDEIASHVDRLHLPSRPESVLLKLSDLAGAARVVVINRSFSGVVPGSYIRRCHSVVYFALQARLRAPHRGTCNSCVLADDARIYAVAALECRLCLEPSRSQRERRLHTSSSVRR